MWDIVYNGEWVFLPMEEMASKLFNHTILLMLMVGFNRIIYEGMNEVFKRNLSEYNALERHQKMYVVKNLTKTFILFIITMIALPWLYDIVVYNEWNNSMMHFIGTLYVSTDLSGLLFVPNLATRTKIHHTVVCLFGMMNLLTDYRELGLHRALLALTYFSAVPYTVNAYLGLRYLNREVIKRKIVDIALYVYALSIFVNLLIQHFYVLHWIAGFSLVKLGYLAKYYSILYDDLKLAQYLYYKYRQKYISGGPKDERRI